MRLLAAAAVGLLSGCVLPEQQPQMPSSVTFRAREITAVQNLIVAHCIQGGSTVTAQTANGVTCEHQLSGSQAFWTQLAIGNAYSTTPVAQIRYSLAQLGTDVMVGWDADVHTQMPGGQINSTQVTDNRFNSTIRDMLVRDGAE